MDAPSLDKIIGSSALNKNTFSVHYRSAATAFVSHGFISVVIPKIKAKQHSKDKQKHDSSQEGQKRENSQEPPPFEPPHDNQRFDFKITEDTKEITALAFSKTGNRLVAGEAGPNARLFIICFSERFDSISETTEIKTKENGFSCVSLDAERGKLVTVGVDPNPFFLLWDLNQPRPVCIGYYHLPSIPSHVILSPNSDFAVVSGSSLLKFLDTDVTPSPTPVVLHSRNANIGKFKSEIFVASAVNLNPPFDVYSLTDKGIIAIFDAPSVSFPSKKPHKISPISATPLDLKCSQTSSLVVDKDLILVGTKEGSILAITKSDQSYRILGKFSSEGRAVVGVGVAASSTAAAYDDGFMIFWQRTTNAKPFLILPGHRGPICSVCQSPQSNDILTGGSDGFVRVWSIQKSQGIIGKSSQQQICCGQVTAKAHDFMTSLKGVRCIAAAGELAVAGDIEGGLHLLKRDKSDSEEVINEIQTITEGKFGTFCVTVSSDGQSIATGSGDGVIRIYNLSGQTMTMMKEKKVHASPVTSIAFSESSVISSSSEGIKFMKAQSSDVYASYDTEQPVLTLAVVPNRKFVVSGCCDGFLRINRESDGKVFRAFKLSQSSYPMVVAVENSGIFVSVAMSDSSVLLIDMMSGDPIFSFRSMAGIITGLIFHDGDLILSSASGFLSRWNLPQSVHNAMAEKSSENLPILDLLKEGEAAAPQGQASLLKQVPGSLMQGNNPVPGWIFKQINVDVMKEQTPEVEQSGEEEEEYQGGFNDPRPSVVGQFESKVDDLVRASYVQKNLPKEEVSSGSGPIMLDIPRSPPAKLPVKKIGLSSFPSEPISAPPPQMNANPIEQPLKTPTPTEKVGLNLPEKLAAALPEKVAVTPLPISQPETPVTVSEPSKPSAEPTKPASSSPIISSVKLIGTPEKPEVQAEPQRLTPNESPLTIEMKAAATELSDIAKKVARLMALKPTDPYEMAAQIQLKTAYEGLQKEALTSDWLPLFAQEQLSAFFEKLKKNVGR